MAHVAWIIVNSLNVSEIHRIIEYFSLLHSIRLLFVCTIVYLYIAAFLSMDMDDVIFKGQSNDPHEVNLLQHMSQFFTQLSKFLAPT